MLELFNAKIATFIEDRSIEALREFFGIENDLDEPEEEEEEKKEEEKKEEEKKEEQKAEEEKKE